MIEIVSNNLNIAEMHVIIYLPSRRVTSACRSSSLVWVKSSWQSTFCKSPCPWEAYLLSARGSSSDLREDIEGLLKACIFANKNNTEAVHIFPILFSNETLRNSLVCFLVYQKKKVSWLYRASSSLAAKNIIILISILTNWWCPCVESSLMLLEEGVCYDQCILLTKLLACDLLFVLQGQICLLLQVSLDILLLHSSPL